MSASIFQLLYLSSAKPELTEEALLQILSESQQRNAAINITGLLLHSDGNIIQVIEGEEEDAVERLFAKINRDTRHHQVIVLYRKIVAKRDFLEYKMGFKRATSEQLVELPGFSNIVENRQLPKATLEGLSRHVEIFLKTFAHSTRLER
jgi:hypothetical protein